LWQPIASQEKEAQAMSDERKAVEEYLKNSYNPKTIQPGDTGATTQPKTVPTTGTIKPPVNR
jgi:hypothetical protein